MPRLDADQIVSAFDPIVIVLDGAEHRIDCVTTGLLTKIVTALGDAKGVESDPHAPARFIAAILDLPIENVMAQPWERVKAIADFLGEHLAPYIAGTPESETDPNVEPGGASSK